MKVLGRGEGMWFILVVELFFCLGVAWMLPEDYPYLLSLNSSFPGEAAEEVRGWYFYILNLGGLQGKRLIWNNTGLGLPGLLILALP